ncbi:MAG TPA: heavy metal-associated domain-containing protein [Candidatus Limnocylindrales bacterium]
MLETIRVPIEGMTCTSCVSRVTRELRKLDGVDRVRVDLATESATVRLDPTLTRWASIASAVERAGYVGLVDRAEPVDDGGPLGLLERFGLRRR